jgi:catechol 2,3-dioxygenase-like lactoylglutathione lyase family enzyme
MIRAREFRLALVTEDYEGATLLFHDALGFETMLDLGGQGGRGVILRLPSATLELVDAEHNRMVDEIEVGEPQRNRLRVAVEVEDLVSGAEAVSEAGAEALAPPVATSWGDRNQRFVASDGLQLTLFQPG